MSSMIEVHVGKGSQRREGVHRPRLRVAKPEGSSCEEKRNAVKRSHPWLMVLCLIGMGSVFLLPALGISLGTVGSFMLMLLCPLSHVIMLWGLSKHRKQSDADAAGLVPAPATSPRERGPLGGDPQAN